MIGPLSNSLNHDIFLNPSCCTSRTPAHEVMHALGRFHEQTRPDRDYFIKVNWPNIIQNCKLHIHSHALAYNSKHVYFLHTTTEAANIYTHIIIATCILSLLSINRCKPIFEARPSPHTWTWIWLLLCDALRANTMCSYAKSAGYDFSSGCQRGYGW